MNNVKVTNMDNGVSIIITKEQFDSCKTCLSENSVYEYTNLPVTNLVMPRQCGKTDTIFDYYSKILNMLGGIKNETDRAAIIRL